MTLQELYYITAYFLIYSFLGWVVEVSYHVIKVGKFINRGFLNGPVCPIYGVGMVGILIMLVPFSDNAFLLFVGGMLFATCVELIGGFVLYKIFHMRWWDYSKEPFNLGGFICLRFSIAWGFCIIFVMKAVHPFVYMNVHFWDGIPGHILLAVFWLLFLADCVATVLTILHLNKDLKRLNMLAEKMHQSSDELTQIVGSTTVKVQTKVDETRLQTALGKAEMRDDIEKVRSEIREELNRIKSNKIAGKIFGYGRLHLAFPDLSHVRYEKELSKLIEYIRK